MSNEEYIDYGYLRCNGCELARLKKKWGERLIKVQGSWYLAGMPPDKGQDEPTHLPNGIPIQFVAWFMSEGHDHTSTMAEEMIDDEIWGGDLKLPGLPDDWDD